MIAQKLKPGDEVRVIAPSRSLGIISKETREIALKRLKQMELNVTFAKNIEEKDVFSSSSIESRVQDMHDAFLDANVKGILTAIGGFNVNQILKYLDYNIIKSNPKILCGFSDITALTNAIYAKTGLITYSGPHFSTFGVLKGSEYTVDYFKKCLFNSDSFEVVSSSDWSDDQWWINQNERNFIKNEGAYVINSGEAEGIITGGNLCTFNLLQGTEYMPDLNGSVLFVEEDEMAGSFAAEDFDRNLQSLIHLPGFKNVRGVIIGRFQKASKITKDALVRIIKTKTELNKIPVIANLDFGHSLPLITFPIGGKVKLNASESIISLSILEH
jgi:muramoyltetrapeptide carboxypeptidase LdcA involved in peptidoglycan recycling